MMKQSVLLAQSPHIVVCTPGRLADHIRSTDTVMLDRIKFLVSGFCTKMNATFCIMCCSICKSVCQTAERIFRWQQPF